MPDLASSCPLLVFDFDCTIIHVDGDDEVNSAQWCEEGIKSIVELRRGASANNFIFCSNMTTTYLLICLPRTPMVGVFILISEYAKNRKFC